MRIGEAYALVLLTASKMSIRLSSNLLMPESEVLFQLRDSFVKLVMRRAKENTHALKVHCYFEELGMTLTGKVRQSFVRTFLRSQYVRL